MLSRLCMARTAPQVCPARRSIRGLRAFAGRDLLFGKSRSDGQALVPKRQCRGPLSKRRGFCKQPKAALSLWLPRWLGRPDPLLGPAPRGTGLATFTASGSSRPVRSDHARPYDSLNRERVVRRSTHRGHDRSASLSIGSGVVVIVVFGVHLTTSALFRAGSRGSVSGRLSETIARRARPSCPGFPLRFRCRRSLLGHPLPAEELGVPRGRLTGQRPDPDGVSAFRTHEL